jgi:putative endonuclease
MRMAYFVCILRSLKDGRLYTGCGGSVRERLDHHNRGGTQSTRNRRPLELMYVEEYPDKPSAMARERQLKSLEGGSEKFRLVAEQTPEMLAEARRRWLG